MATLAFMTSALGNFWCETIVFYPETGSNSSIPDLYFGPWYLRETQYQTTTGTNGQPMILAKNVCVDYPNGTPMDSKWKTVKAMSILVLILSAFPILGLYIAPCYGHLNSSWNMIAIFFSVFITLLQGLCFLWLQDGSACDAFTPLYGLSSNTEVQDSMLSTTYPNRCELSGGSKSAISATVLFFCTGLAMIALGAPKIEPRAPPQTQEVIYQKTQNPDGTSTVQEVNVIKGTAVHGQQKPPEATAVTGLEGGGMD